MWAAHIHVPFYEVSKQSSVDMPWLYLKIQIIYALESGLIEPAFQVFIVSLVPGKLSASSLLCFIIIETDWQTNCRKNNSARCSEQERLEGIWFPKNNPMNTNYSVISQVSVNTDCNYNLNFHSYTLYQCFLTSKRAVMVF